MFNHPENQEANVKTEAEDVDILGYFSIVIAHAVPETLRPEWNTLLHEFRLRICAEAREEIETIRREKKGENRKFSYQQKMRFFFRLMWPAIELAVEQPRYRELIVQTFKKKWKKEASGKYDLFPFLSDRQKIRVKAIVEAPQRGARQQELKALANDEMSQEEIQEELDTRWISPRASRVVFDGRSGR